MRGISSCDQLRLRVVEIFKSTNSGLEAENNCANSAPPLVTHCDSKKEKQINGYEWKHLPAVGSDAERGKVSRKWKKLLVRPDSTRLNRDRRHDSQLCVIRLITSV